MNEAIARMLKRYGCQSVEDHVRALREIMQEIALLGLWRHLNHGEQIAPEKFVALITEAVDKLDVNQARKEVEPFVKNTDALEVWSGEFFQDIVAIIVLV